MVLRSKNTSVNNNRKKPKKHSSRTSWKAAGNKLDIDLDSLLSKNHKRGAKPKNLKEKDPILDAFKETRHPCDKCEKDFGTILCLNQHLQGKHGNGAITLCGIKYQWPDSQYKHQVDCDDCKKLKEKQKQKSEYPHKIIVRMRKPKKLVAEVQMSQLRCICCDQLIFSKQQTVSCKYVFDFF